MICDSCDGKWVDKDSQKTTCSVCQGKWVSVSVQRTPFGSMQMQSTCGSCGGSWYKDSKPCAKCSGNGLTTRQEQIKIEIPSGIESGQYIKYPGMWNYWMGRVTCLRSLY